MGVEKEYGFAFGRLEKGRRNLVSDVPGVKVGHCTLHEGDIHTGVTAIFPHGGDLFHDKCVAAAHVINGFGKSTGLVQVMEMGAVETPLILTNTLSVGVVWDALAGYMLERNEDIGVATGTMNPLVFECNDGALNDIRARRITGEHVLRALAAASEEFEEGAVGAGAGMSCYGLKGGIGSASRVIELYGNTYTLGALLLTNFGSLRDLTICGDGTGERLYRRLSARPEADKGSVIVVLATDAPLSSRQLLRAAKRAQSGIARTGSISGNGSGEIVIAFSTTNCLPHYTRNEPVCIRQFFEDDMELVFRAVIECVSESVVSSMLHAERTVGRAGNIRESLKTLLKEDT
ncbi:MAG TPA: P1 family peptidase [Clostridia bacterium]|nr:P1 family peptidase [Clostridia bacterium]